MRPRAMRPGRPSSADRWVTGHWWCPNWPRRQPELVTSPWVRTALDWLSERSRATPNEWARGIEARVRALLSDGEGADSRYRESIELLTQTPVRTQLARAHLLYGEWLRRERRRAEARDQLRTAHEMLDVMGIGAFAERARRELLATGETARKRTVETAIELTAQEAQVARL